MGQYVASRCRVRASGPNADARLARWLRDFVEFEQAYAAGEMLRENLEYLRLKLDSPLTHLTLRNDQHIFVDLARDGDFKGFVTASQSWLVHVDPDGVEPEDQLKKTSLSLRKGRGGRVEVDGLFDAITGQAVSTAVEREAQQLYRQDGKSGSISKPAAAV